MRFRRFAALLLALIMLSGSCLAAGTDYGTFGDELTEEQYDFIYNGDNYRMTFTPGIVIVALKKGLTEEDVDFPGIEYSRIYTVPPEYYGQGEAENAVLFLRLKDSSKFGVLSAVSVLKENEDVLYAEPFYNNSNIGGAAATDSPSVSAGTGDINYDGKLTNTDLITLARYVVRLTSLTYNQLQRADMNGDGRVNNTDLVILAKKVVGIR